MSGYNKYFTLSYDDGLEQDKKIISLLKKYGIRATFNLNSGLFGKEENIEYFHTFGFRCVNKSVTRNGILLKTVPACRIPEDEIKQVYDGFELATHAVSHANLTKLSDGEVEAELLEDQEILQRYTDIPVVGHAFPFGATGPNVNRILKENGFLYARTVMSARGHARKRFAFPDDPLKLNPTCWHISHDVEKLLDTFLSTPAENGDMLFYMWGHGYEIDFEAMKTRRFWETFERMLDKVACDDSIIKCTNAEAIRSHLADKS